MSDTPDRLKSHFHAVPFGEHNNRWDSLWAAGDFLPWDRGQPSPALTDALTDRHDLLGTPVRSDGRRKRALVPGCGKGYDVLLLASFGYDVIGLDVSENSVKGSREYAKTAFEEYGVRDKQYGVGTYKFVKGDFFEDEWLSVAGVGLGEFELISDYTFLCALPPSQRPAWALRMTQLLAPQPQGRLLCLEFPLKKDPKIGGPPFGLSADAYMAHLTRPGQDLVYDDAGYPETSQNVAQGENSSNTPGLERLDRWKAKRTFPAGKDSDCVSVWSHR